MPRLFGAKRISSPRRRDKTASDSQQIAINHSFTSHTLYGVVSFSIFTEPPHFALIPIHFSSLTTKFIISASLANYYRASRGEALTQHLGFGADPQTNLTTLVSQYRPVSLVNNLNASLANLYPTVRASYLEDYQINAMTAH